MVVVETKEPTEYYDTVTCEQLFVIILDTRTSVRVLLCWNQEQMFLHIKGKGGK